MVRPLVVCLGVAALASSPAGAAELPPHGPLRVLIVSDEVNPNNLSDAELTQPGDLGEALGDPASGLSVASVLEVGSQCVDDALAALGDPGAVDVFVYFAHKAARGCDASDRQAELTTGVAALLAAGGGVVVFHHGIYEAAGKQEILQLLGGTASAIEWNTGSGQAVLDVAPGHFVTTNSVEYTGQAMYADPQSGVPAGTYERFVNKPDERYPALALLTAPGETRQVLFASDYANNGSTHVLGYDLQRPGWAGRVVFYQPGEYQPQALDDREGNNFQILANAIVHVAPEAGGGESSSGGSSGGDPGETGGGSTGGGSTGGGAETGAPTTSGGGGSSGGGGGGESSGGGGGGESSGGASGGATGEASAGAETGGTAPESGCGCRQGGGPGGLVWLLGLGWLGRRRAGRADR